MGISDLFGGQSHGDPRVLPEEGIAGLSGQDEFAALTQLFLKSQQASNSDIIVDDINQDITKGGQLGIMEMRKALDSGYDVGGATQTGGAAWRLEFLENTLAILSERMRHIVFYNDVPKADATSTAIEYARRLNVGQAQGGWYGSGELPLPHDSTYDRQVGLIKFLGDVREIKMPFLRVRTLTDQRSEVTNAGTQWLLSQLERTLFKGNAKLGVGGAEFEEIDGLETFVDRDASADNVINLWGQPLEEGNIRNAGQVVIDARGIGSHLYAPSDVLEDYSAAYLKQQWIPTPTAQGGLSMGMRVEELKTVGGDYRLRPLFMYKGLTMETPPTSAPTLAPAPDPASAAIALQAGTSFWGNSLGLTQAGAGSSGIVEYQVGYGNKYGESVPIVSTPTSLTIPYANRANREVRITITNPAGFTAAPTYAAIYRRDTDNDSNTSSWGCVGRIALTSTVGAAAGLVWDDNGENMPGTRRAWFGELSQDVLHMSQLLPLTRIPLPQLTLAERFALVMFVAFIMRIPNRWVEFRNIGRRTV